MYHIERNGDKLQPKITNPINNRLVLDVISQLLADIPQIGESENGSDCEAELDGQISPQDNPLTELPKNASPKRTLQKRDFGMPQSRSFISLTSIGLPDAQMSMVPVHLFVGSAAFGKLTVEQ
ncbi:unnamed protein product [Acanthoscelides obtectus]|uniref:Uncharacterized protein n=1 Tax=Acanthoscelides obtectus TaxID=200917 RepID=A0A9P0M019_ACAOB|nr:unnamed protein product [Acanthoscelides obtectus]CAK1680541.1 hypothetical protein AOBTE_LOCUS32742 [Acanthoscelides obtectus]